MAKMVVGEKTYKTKSEMLIFESKDILDTYDEPVTLRQLYYRLVTKGIIENCPSQYQALSKAMKQARMEGDVDWDAIEDRGRSARHYKASYKPLSPDYYVSDAVDEIRNLAETTALRYSYARWYNQPYYIEVWVEKQALERLFQNACDPWCVTTFACSGYSSMTAMNNAAERFDVYKEREKKILYFGDYDPSGIDIERDIRKKMADFGISLLVDRIALTRAQIDEHQLPPAPAKKKDSRYADFAESHGDMAVELDALEPPVLTEMITSQIGLYFNEDIRAEFRQKTEEGQEYIRTKLEELIPEI
jgi:hypothetical protein